jgi:hypothetical protein
MKNLLLVLLLPISNCLVAQVTYVNYFDAVYPLYGGTGGYPPFDVNSDGANDFYIFRNYISMGYNMSFNSANGTSNRLNSLASINPGNTDYHAIDCLNDTLNAIDLWQTQSIVIYDNDPVVTIGTHKQGFKLLLTNPANGALGAKYGYIDYTLSSDFDVIIHGFYYQNTFNAPIWANSQLTFPSDLNCLQIDTVTVYDTITTNVTIYDTITTNITTYDTLLVSVTDTLFINTSLGLPAPNNTNAIMVYPNPANDHITIDNGNFALMSNYTLKIENSLGQQVFSSLVNQQQFYVDLNGWSGNGVYFLKLINPQNNIVTIRKIVLQ